MNSWKSTLLSAWAPPLSTFIIGTGRVVASAPPRKRYRGSPASAAAARATASETPRIALAPSRDLLGVPSRSIRVRSMAPCSEARAPTSASAMSRLTLETALRHPLAAPGLAPVAQLHGLELAGRGAGGNSGAPGGLRVERHLDLDRRVSPRVEDLACVDALDRRHGRGSLPGPRCSRPARGSAAPKRGGRARGRRAGGARGRPARTAPRRSSARPPRGSPGRRSSARARRPRARRRGRAAGACARTEAPAGSRARRRTARPRPSPPHHA